MGSEMKDPVAAYFDKHAESHKRQFVGSGSGASFYFQKRLTLACELAEGSSGRLLDCAAGSGEITCALLESGKFPHATLVDISSAMLQRARELLSSQVTNVELEFIKSDVFTFRPSDSNFDLILCLGLIAHVGRLDTLLALRIVEMRQHSLGIRFGDRFSRWANFQLKKRFQKWVSRHGADAIYLLGAK